MVLMMMTVGSGDGGDGGSDARSVSVSGDFGNKGDWAVVGWYIYIIDWRSNKP